MLWKYVLCCLNNKNWCLNTTKHPNIIFSFLSVEWHVILLLRFLVLRAIYCQRRLSIWERLTDVLKLLFYELFLEIFYEKNDKTVHFLWILLTFIGYIYTFLPRWRLSHRIFGDLVTWTILSFSKLVNLWHYYSNKQAQLLKSLMVV